MPSDNHKNTFPPPDAQESHITDNLYITYFSNSTRNLRKVTFRLLRAASSSLSDHKISVTF